MTDDKNRISSPQIKTDRFIVQKRLPEIGNDGQNKLQNAKVLIVGCGALGSPVAVYLAAAGIGTIALADFDTVDISNLHRQVFYTLDSCGKKKVDELARVIAALNPEVRLITYDTLVNQAFLTSVIRNFDFIVDAADNPQTTYTIDRVCAAEGVGYVTAGISGWEAQIFTYCKGGPTFRSIFPPPDQSEGIMPCAVAGVLGPLAGMVASIQASETIKSILGLEGTLDQAVLTIDLLSDNFIKFPLKIDI